MNIKTLLHKAVEKRSLKKVRMLLAHGADVNEKTKELTVLHYACIKGDEKLVKLLLKYNANLSLTHEGKTPLMYAVINEREGIINILLELGKNIGCRDMWSKNIWGNYKKISFSRPSATSIMRAKFIVNNENEPRVLIECNVGRTALIFAGVLLSPFLHAFQEVVLSDENAIDPSAIDMSCGD